MITKNKYEQIKYNTFDTRLNNAILIVRVGVFLCFNVERMKRVIRGFPQPEKKHNRIFA